jgi:endonuclease/exonuclease/phosphatase family metal-dependent hydrolase
MLKLAPRHKIDWLKAGGLVAATSAIGVIAIILVLAAATPIALEAESGQLSGPAQTFAIADASDGQTVKFSSPPTPTPTPTPAPTPSPTPRPTTTFTIASWNTKYDNTASNLGTEVATVTASAPIVGLQEVHDPAKRQQIRDKVLCPTCAYASRSEEFNYDGSSPASLPIIWKKSQFQVVGTPGSLQVSPKTTVNDSAGAEVSAKYITWVKLREPVTGKTFYVLNTHTVASVEAGGKPNQSNPKRLTLYQTHMDKLVAQINTFKQDNIPIFITGDFNVNYRYDSVVKDSMFPYVRLGAVGVKSDWQLTNLAGIPTTQGTEGANNRIIDYVFELVRSDVTPRSVKINSSTLGSDHYPVFFTLQLM